MQHWEAYQRDADAHVIAHMFATSATTVQRVVATSQAAGTPREPRQGQGKRDDQRWVFAGSKQAANLARLEQAVGDGPVDDHVVRRRICDAATSMTATGGEPAVSTVGQQAARLTRPSSCREARARARRRASATCGWSTGPPSTRPHRRDVRRGGPPHAPSSSSPPLPPPSSPPAASPSRLATPTHSPRRLRAACSRIDGRRLDRASRPAEKMPAQTHLSEAHSALSGPRERHTRNSVQRCK